MYVTPQTDDGWVRSVQAAANAHFEVEVVFPVTDAFRDRVQGREKEIVFAARSRLARLGINVVPSTPPTWDGDRIEMRATVSATVSAYGVEPFLKDLVRPGLHVGRLVFCPAEQRLTSTEILEAVRDNTLQLPVDYSIDGDGRFTIRPSGHIYGLHPALTFEDLMTIAVRADGKDLLNRMQVRERVDQIVLPPGDGVITSCAMFLHKHYVVLDPEAGPLGQHLEAVVLDPISTRGTSVFLEFANHGDNTIVNPTVRAEVYHADPLLSRTRRWYGTGVELQVEAKGRSRAQLEYEELVGVFERLEEGATPGRYSHRVVAAVDDPLELVAGKPPIALWVKPHPEEDRTPILDVSSRLRDGVEVAARREHGTRMLADLPSGAGATLLLGYFPNLVEHLEICAAALDRRIKRIIFRRASYEHGSFLSARDHGRLADYEGLGVEVFWCHEERQHVVRHVFRGLRGFFVKPEDVERFRTSLIIASYGSALRLPDQTFASMRTLFADVNAFFGNNVSIMTGGGPGSMQQATDVADELDMLVGASFIEAEGQKTNESASYYQTFQGRSRQARQRWFEVASFHLFFMGGVGTLEEVGLTLTDMKLGVIERSPIVFFGPHGDEPYWTHLREQLDVMMAEGRAPDWLSTHTLVTSDPYEVTKFYKQVLELG